MSEQPTTKDYKATLNLPATDFPMKGNLGQLEPKMLAFWDEHRVFEAMLAKNQSRPPFVLHDGPPYANGKLHAGHALNKILKDIVVKYQNLAGRRADFMPGWDCHGLPIEQAVEKKLREQKVDKRTMSREAFLQKCREYALEYIDVQAAEFKRMGVFARWDAKYRTLDFDYEAQEIRELAKFAASGALFRKNRPVFWCVYDQTALALAEVEYEDIKVPSTYVAFPAHGDLAAKWGFLAGKQVAFAIWTTTPWTLPANLAISVHPKFEYVFYELSPGRVVVVAKGLLAKALADFAPEHLKVKDVTLGEASFDAAVFTEPQRILGYALGEELEKLEYRHAFLDKTLPIVTGEHVTLEAGTGLVHTAPGHGPDDYEVGLRYGLDIYNPVKADGRYDDTVGAGLAGQFVFDANETVPKLLQEKGALLNQPGEFITTSYPHSWRSKKPVIFRATPQWFISMDATGLRQRALEQIDSAVTWVPAWGRDRIHGMLSTRPDWTISRQRTWGVPIPTAVCSACNEALIDAALMNRVADVVAKEGAAAWYEKPLSAFRPEGATCPACKKDTLQKETDILDVWFDSACSFAAVIEAREKLPVPVDLYLEGSDQHRGWFHSSLLVGVGTRGRAPYKTCLTHGFVVDGNGNKMSKSMGNTVSPDDITKKHGAEVMRLWVAASDYRDDVRLSMGILDGLAEGYRKIRNTVRYALSVLSDFDPTRDAVADAQLPPLEQWVSARLDALVEKVKKAYDAYEFHLVFHAIVEFCANELSAQYFDISKDTLYTGKKTGPGRRAAQTVLYRVARELLVMLAPVTSFTAEEAWQYLPGEKPKSVFLVDFPAPRGGFKPETVAALDGLFGVRKLVLPLLEAARRDKLIGKSLEAKVTLAATGATKQLIEGHAADLAELFIVSQVELAAAPGDKATKVSDELSAEVARADGNKCPRCWAYRPEVGAQELCARCTDAVAV
jgi:isoleucyl-tRNA synthetase